MAQSRSRLCSFFLSRIKLKRTLTLAFGLALGSAPSVLAESYELDEVPNHLSRFQTLGEFYEANPELTTTKSSGWKPYNRALWFASTRPIGESGTIADARSEALTRRGAADAAERGNGWFSIGPSEMSGRCLAVDFDPNDPSTVYIASASGGLWKSSDGGNSYAPLTDDFPTLAAGAVCVLAWDSDVVLLGTGEGSGAGYGPFGIGIYRSTDAGATWSPTNLTIPIGTFQGFNVIEDNPATQTILAGSSSGLYRSTDDGLTWSLVEGNGNFYDVKWKPGSANTVYITKGRDPFTNSQIDNGVKISTDDGLTFSLLGNGQPNGAIISKTKIGVTAADPEMIYAHYVNSSASYNTLGIYRSTDGGATWVQRNGTINMTGAQGWYNNVMNVDPDDPEVIVTGGVNLYRSTNGGTSFTNLNPGVAFGTETLPHWDHHALTYEPGSNDVVWVLTDGGPWRSTDDGLTWASRREGLVTYQFYDICVAQTDPLVTIGGTQDNGIPLRTGFDDWFESTLVADGMVCNIDPFNEDRVFAEWQFGNHVRSSNGGINWFPATNGITGTGIWVTPVDLDQNDADHLYTMTNAGIFRTNNGALNWQQVATHFARWISISPIDGDFVWTVSNFSSVWHTEDDGVTWIFSSSFPATGTETKIHADPFDIDTAYVTFGGYATGIPHILRTTDRGLSWHDVTGDFPDVPANTFIVDPGVPTDWYVGSDVGVWRSQDEGVTWTPYGAGLANATITDLEIRRETRKLVAGTYGRGAWEVDLPGDPASVDPSVASTRNLMLDPPRPNPVSDSATLRFAASTSEPAELSIFDAEGRRVSETDPVPNDGIIRTVQWNRGDLPAGVYFAVLRAGDQSLTRKIVVDR